MLTKNNIFSKSLVVHNKLAIIFILLIFTDVVSKVGDILLLPISHTASIFKLLFQFLLLYWIFKSCDKNSLKILTYIFFLFLIFFTGHIFLKSENLLLARILNNIKNFDWYIFVFIFQASLVSFLSSENIQAELKNLFKAFEFFFYINCLCIIVGIIFNLEFFKAYYNTERFGFNGLLRNPTHASFIFIIYILYFHYKAKVEKSKKTQLQLCFSIIICLTLMTKAIILFVLLYFVYQAIVLKKYYFLMTLFSILSGMILFFKEIFESFVKVHSRVLYNVYKEEGIITMLFSFRDKAIEEKYIPYINDNWTFGNYIFGGAEFNLMRTEFELLDLYWLFGIGGIVYLYIYNKYILSVNILCREFPILFLSIVIFLAGSFFSSAPVVPFFLVFTTYYNLNTSYLKNS